MSAQTEKRIKRQLQKDSKLKVEFITKKQKPYVKATAEQVSAVQSSRTLGGNDFQEKMSNLLREYGVGKTPLIVPKINVVTRQPSTSGSKSIYDFYDPKHGKVFEMAQSVGDGKEAKMEKDILSVKIFNPNLEYVAVVEVERDSEKYRKNRSSYRLLEESVDHVCYGENEFREYLKRTYVKQNYNEGKLMDVDIDHVDILEINRDINDKWVQTLCDYILVNGFITNIIVVPYVKDGMTRYLIIDGNHRFYAKRKLISYGIYPKGKEGIENKNKIQVLCLDWIDGNDTKLVHQICIQINLTNKTWDVIDYIRSFIKYFKKVGLTQKENDYKILNKVYKEFNNSMSAVYITANTGMRNFKDGMGKVKEGNWECDKEVYSQITIPLLKLYKDIVNDSKKYGKFTNTALQWLLTFVKVEMIKRLEQGSHHKLLNSFTHNLVSGKYKKLKDVNDIKNKLIPILEIDFNKNFPITK